MDEVRGSEADSESLILVDEADREVGHLDKVRCHQGHGNSAPGILAADFQTTPVSCCSAARGLQAVVAAVLVQQLLQPSAAG